MTSKPYKDYEKVLCHLAGRPDVVKMVDTMHGVIYINQDAAPDAKIVLYLTEYSNQFCGTA